MTDDVGRLLLFAFRAFEEPFVHVRREPSRDDLGFLVGFSDHVVSPCVEVDVYVYVKNISRLCQKIKA